jgi:hypothetical protein
MRLVTLVLVLTISLGSVIAGKIHWNHKISAYSGKTSNLVLEEESTQTKKETETVVKDSNEDIELLSYANNLPNIVKDKIGNSIETGTPVRFLIMGSKSTSSDALGWPNLLKQELVNAYGENVFEITVLEIPDKNSIEVINEGLYSKGLEFKPDLLLLEPFILKDNGEVRMEDRLLNIDRILSDFKNENPTISFYLQPSNPLFNATYYPKEVEELKAYAENNNIGYLNHWEAWPDQQSSELEGYLSPDPAITFKSIPNEKGNKVWANYLIDHFISKK